MTAKEIKNYIDMMKHTLNRRMDNQEGKDWLIDKYCNDMQKGMDAIEELETIKSADGGEAIKILQKLATIPLNIDDNHWTTLSTQDDYKSLENYILKAQAQEQELRELKKNNQEILELLVKLINRQMLGQEGLVIVNQIKNKLVGE